MTNAQSQQQTAISQLLHQAVTQHQAGQLHEAETSYRAILEIYPKHSEANHNMGVLAVQRKRSAESLPYFTVALDADPTRGRYWLNYIDALLQAGQLEGARQVLALAQQQGLHGDAVDSLAGRLQASAQLAGQNNTILQQAANKKINPGKKPSLPQGKNPSQKEINTLVALFNRGYLAEAAALAQTMTVRFPRHWVGWKMLGVVFNQMKRSADALVPMQKTIAFLPDDAEAHNNLGITLQELGRLDEAEASYRQALRINPGYAHAHGNLGVVLQNQGRLNEAEASYRRAIQIKPDYAKAHCNLGAILHDLRRLNEAEISLRRALQLNPDYAEAHSNLGITLQDIGRLEEANASHQRAIQTDVNVADAHFNLGNSLKALGKLEEAEASYRQALQINPNHAPTLNNLGTILHDMDRLDGAEASYRRAIQINPDYAEAHNNLGSTLNALGRTHEAEASYRWAIQIKPDLAEAHSNLGSVMHDSGHLEEAESSLRRALAHKPDFSMAHSNLLFCITENSTVDAQQLFAEHCRFGMQFESPLLRNHQPHTNSRDPERCLQVGFVSGDFRNHAVASFIEPLLTYLTKYPQLSLHAYANHAADDAITMRLRKNFAHWHPISRLPDATLAENIRSDGIDILIDLSGHSAKNRLTTFARKPAPVQLSWIGYPGTTGLKSMDYFVTDQFFLPRGKLDEQFTEKIVHLPASVPFSPDKNAPPVTRLPTLNNGYVTFGSFNRISKLSRSVIALWSQLLRALPDSRLVLGGMPEDSDFETLVGWFSQERIARERLDFHPRSDMHSYLARYQQVDVCLDTFPYTGGTTTLHAIWMGVPTITLAGNTAAGRSGASILYNLGLEEFVAYDTTDFVRKGLYWAGNPAELSNIRAGLRTRFSESAMSRPDLIAASLERALRIMWQRWCAGLQAEPFGVTQNEITDAQREHGQ